MDEAREGLEDLLRAVERGEEIAITRDGRRVGRIVAPAQAHDMTPAEAFAHLKEIRESLPKRGPSVRELIEEIRAEREG